VCGFLSDEEKAAIEREKATTKKNALVILYKLWSALTKNIRYNIDSKGKAVSIPRFGTFMRDHSDPTTVTFVAGADLANVLNFDRPSGEFSVAESTIGPEWHKIAPAAQIPSQELATLFGSAVILMAVQKAKQGEQVCLNLKFGKLTLSQGEVRFISDRLSSTHAAGRQS